jgi:broad specificity phosphatase PhoE
LYEPRHLYAVRPTPEAPSVRPLRTLQPLADVLGLPVSLEFAKGQEKQLVEAITQLRECVLVCWEHTAILDIARLLLGASDEIPREWPEDRYDIVWVFERQDAAWRFTQVPELLLAGDRSALIE